jgi:hypothetical protein
MVVVQRRSLQTVLQALAEQTQARVAELANVDPTAVSRMGAPKGQGDDTRTEWERITAILAACNLRVVPCSTVSIDPDELRALRTLAAKRAQDMDATSGFGGLT